MQSMTDIDLNLLLVLDAVLRESSVTRAAERLNKSPPAISHSLSKLRELLGDPLLVRAGRSMVLTPRAEALAPKVSHAVQLAGALLRPVGELAPEEIERTFRLLATDHALAVLGAQLDALLTERAPLADLHVLPYGGPELTNLREGRIDVAVGVFPDTGPELRQKKLFEDRFVCVTRAGRDELSLDNYLDATHVLVSPRGGKTGVVDRVLADKGQERRVARTVPYFWSALQIVAASDHVVTISERIAKRAADEFDVEIHPPPIELDSYTLWALWHPRFDEDPTHRWFRDTLVSAV
jgi:DNA-binding transcriptional LysR family regulator